MAPLAIEVLESPMFARKTDTLTADLSPSEAYGEPSILHVPQSKGKAKLKF